MANPIHGPGSTSISDSNSLNNRDNTTNPRDAGENKTATPTVNEDRLTLSQAGLNININMALPDNVIKIENPDQAHSIVEKLQAALNDNPQQAFDAIATNARTGITLLN